MALKTSVVGLLVAALMGLFGAEASVAARSVHKVYGTNGLDGFLGIKAGATDECPKGSYFTGVVGNVGAWIDQITVVCSKLKPDGTLGGGTSMPSRGGTGGAFKQALCGPNAAVTGFSIGRDINYNLTSLRLMCVNLSTSARHGVNFASNGYWRNTTQDCGSAELGGGLVTKFGEFVKGIGLICSDFKLAPPQQKEALPPGPRKCPYGQILKHGMCRSRKSQPGTSTGDNTMPPPPPANTCTVSKTGALYDAPQGKGRENGELAANTQGVTLLGKSGANWFNVKWPNGEGWVYSGPGFENAIACP
jgi:hypothetical protein